MQPRSANENVGPVRSDVTSRAAFEHPATLRALPEDSFRLREFVLLPRSRLLLRDGEAVDIGGRAFDLLHLLLKARGTVVERDQIFARVWRNTTVVEGSLRLQIANLRRILGDDRDVLKTVPGRGYLIVDEHAALPIPDRTAEPMQIATPSAVDALESLESVLQRVLYELRDLKRQVSLTKPRSDAGAHDRRSLGARRN